MTHKTIEDVTEMMRDIDFCHLVTMTEDGEFAARPMSTNNDVDLNGESHFFTLEHERMVAELETDPRVGLTFQGSGGVAGLFGAPGNMVAVQGRARIVRDKAAFADHWHPELDRWFRRGIDTPGLVMLTVTARRIAWWEGEDHGEVVMARAAA